MDLLRRHAWISAALFAVAILFVFLRLQSFGIWDPWELNIADAARRLMNGEPVEGAYAPLPLWLVKTGFSMFGTREWAGRLPIALTAIAALATTWGFTRAFSNVKAATYTLVVLASSPLFLFNARQMLGDAPVFFGQALLAWGAAGLLFPTEQTLFKDSTRIAASAVLLVLGLVISTTASGVMVGVLPVAIGATVAASMNNVQWRTPSARPVIAAWLVTIGMIAGVAVSVAQDPTEYSFWLGGASHGMTPPTYEAVIEKVFHAFAPWSALLPLAFGRLLMREDDGKQLVGGSLRVMLLVWASVGYATHLVFESRYGTMPYINVVALAIAVGLFIVEIDESERSWWSAAIVAFFFAGLILRDFAIYPVGPVDSLGLANVSLPEAFNPKLEWIAVLGLFAIVVALVLGVGPEPRKLALKEPLNVGRQLWAQSIGNKVWLALGALLIVGIIVFSVICMVASNALGLPTLVAKWGTRAIVVPFLIPVGYVAVRLVLVGFSKLGQYRVMPLLAAGLVVGGFSSLRFQPELSNHLSPREIYDVYNARKSAGEPLAEYRVGGRAAAYYAHGEVREIGTDNELARYLAEPGRRWAAFPTEELPNVDRAFRAITHRHLFIIDAHSARLTLASSEPVAGIENANVLERFVFNASDVVDESGRPRSSQAAAHRVNARFEDKIELIGYDLELPHDGYVGAGESFKIKWHYRVLQSIAGGYKVFVHVDGMGNRLNGDHDPVGDKYPVRYWSPGDLIVDEQELHVPANYRPGNYTIFMGFWVGETRLRVEQGPHDDVNRVNAGILRVQ